MSRSDNMPARRPPAPRITTAPMRCVDKSFAAAASVAVGSMLMMSPPFLGGQDCLDVHGSLLVPEGAQDPRLRVSGERSCRLPGSVKAAECAAAFQCGIAPNLAASFSERRIEPGKQEQAGEEPADMRLPGHRLARSAAAKVKPAPNRILMPNQTIKKTEHARIGEHEEKRNRRHAIGILRAVTRGRLSGPPRWKAKRIAPAMVPEIAADAPITAAVVAAMREQMQHRAGRRGDGEECEKTQRTETARDRAAERQEPDDIDAEMNPVGVNQRVGDEGPELGAPAAGQNIDRTTTCCRSAPE